MRLTIWTEKKIKDAKTSTQHYFKFLRWEFIEPTLFQPRTIRQQFLICCLIVFALFLPFSCPSFPFSWPIWVVIWEVSCPSSNTFAHTEARKMVTGIDCTFLHNGRAFCKTPYLFVCLSLQFYNPKIWRGRVFCLILGSAIRIRVLLTDVFSANLLWNMKHFAQICIIK